MSQSHIRNFCIIAHIDHGKSTLADRILEFCGAIKAGGQEQVLDSMDLERERGITIKMASVRLDYTGRDGKKYEFNLIDTPGHVDFSYEVSRSLAACEGALLVIDAAQGVEAQTLANVSLARTQRLALVPVINKIDLPAADPEMVRHQLEELLQIDGSTAIAASGKTGEGIEDLLEAIVQRVPPPSGDPKMPLRALIFDSHYDQYQGVVPYIRIVDGKLERGDKIRMMSTGKTYEVTDCGVFLPQQRATGSLTTGEVGFIVAQIRNAGECQVGDTVTLAEKGAPEPLPGYKRAKPMVFCGLYPVDSTQYTNLRESLAKLQLNDAALSFEAETSAALGFGFRCGFLGLLHTEIVQERLEREFGMEIIATAPSVAYRVLTTKGEVLEVDNPKNLPPPTEIEMMEEPVVDAVIITPKEFVGACLELCQERRGKFEHMAFSSETTAVLDYTLPLAEIVSDFFDQLKSRTRGYATFDYEFKGFQEADLVKLDILVNGDIVDALSFITHKDFAYQRGRGLVERLRKILPRQQFEIRLQAAIGAKIIASERISPLRKNVLAKCYGGDITRKRKLLEKQKEGKKRMKMVGSVEIPQEAFLSVLKVDG
jgi:GTP-binding protein LepA